MPATDNYSTYPAGLEAPASGCFAITPHDTNEMTRVTRGIYVGVGGDIKVTTTKGDTVTFTAVPQGVILPVRAKIVFSTGTTATTLIGME